MTVHRPVCRTCEHHPAEREPGCACECHELASKFVDAGISEARNWTAQTEGRRRRVGEALQFQQHAKQRLRELTLEMHPRKRA